MLAKGGHGSSKSIFSNTLSPVKSDHTKQNLGKDKNSSPGFAPPKEPEEMTTRELKRIEMSKTKAKMEKS